jgi:hypothetical protein
MSSNVSAAAIAGDHMLVSETGIERMQLLGQVPGSAFLISAPHSQVPSWALPSLAICR